jgi:hypothetical protein
LCVHNPKDGKMSAPTVLDSVLGFGTPNTSPDLSVCAAGENHSPRTVPKRKRKRRQGPRKKKRREQWLPTKRNRTDPTVSTLASTWTRAKAPGRRKFKQMRAQCGHAALNNAFGDGGEEIIKLDLLHNIADKLNREAPPPPPESRKKQVVYGGEKGNFHVKTMQLACTASGYKMEKHMDVHGRYPSHMKLPHLEAQGRYVGLGFTGRGEDTHWFAMDTDNGLVIDSATKGFLKLDSAGILKAVSFGISKLYKITKL